MTHTHIYWHAKGLISKEHKEEIIIIKKFLIWSLITYRQINKKQLIKSEN